MIVSCASVRASIAKCIFRSTCGSTSDASSIVAQLLGMPWVPCTCYALHLNHYHRRYKEFDNQRVAYARSHHPLPFTFVVWLRFPNLPHSSVKMILWNWWNIELLDVRSRPCGHIVLTPAEAWLWKLNIQVLFEQPHHFGQSFICHQNAIFRPTISTLARIDQNPSVILWSYNSIEYGHGMHPLSCLHIQRKMDKRNSITKYGGVFLCFSHKKSHLAGGVNE